MSIFTDVNTPFEVIQKALPLIPPEVLKRKWEAWQRKQRARIRAEAAFAREIARWDRQYGRTPPPRPVSHNEKEEA